MYHNEIYRQIFYQYDFLVEVFGVGSDISCLGRLSVLLELRIRNGILYKTYCFIVTKEFF